MRYHEVSSTFHIPVSNEEQELLNKAKYGVQKKDLDEREKQLVQYMISKGLLNYEIDKNGEVKYFADSIDDIWRD